MKSTMDHRETLSPAFSTTRMYRADYCVNVATSGEDVPVAAWTLVKFTPSVDNSTS